MLFEQFPLSRSQLSRSLVDCIHTPRGQFGGVSVLKWSFGCIGGDDRNRTYIDVFCKHAHSLSATSPRYPSGVSMRD